MVLPQTKPISIFHHAKPQILYKTKIIINIIFCCLKNMSNYCNVIFTAWFNDIFLEHHKVEMKIR